MGWKRQAESGSLLVTRSFPSLIARKCVAVANRRQRNLGFPLDMALKSSWTNCRVGGVLKQVCRSPLKEQHCKRFSHIVQ